MINWRRGLFRFWIVSAIFWIIGSGVISFGEYDKAVKKESKIKQIVSEIKNPEKALAKIKDDFPEFKQYGPIKDGEVIFLGPIDKNESRNIFLKPVPPFKEKHEKLSVEEIVLNMICEKAINDRIVKLNNILLASIIPPLFLLIIGYAIYWALRGFRIREDAKNYETK